MDVKSEEKSLSAGDESQLIALLRPLLSALATLIEELRNSNALQADMISRLLEQNQQQMAMIYAHMTAKDDDDEDEDSFTDLEGNPIKVS